MKGYVLVRFPDEEVLPAVIEHKDKYVFQGEEVMMDEGETGVAVTSIAGMGNPEKELEEIAKMFHRDPEKLPRIIGTISRDYWNEPEPERDWRADV